MAHSARKLHFVVGTSLMTAALLTPSVGCSKKHTVNERPPDDLHINEGPQPEPDPDSADAGSVEPDQPEPPPEDEPEAPPDGPNVNTQPVPDRR